MRYFFAFLLILSLSLQLKAQFLPRDTSTKKTESKPVWPEDTLGRRTPRGTVNGFIKAVSLQDYDKAGLYLKLDPSHKKKDKPLLAKGLQYILEHNGRFYPSSRISDSQDGVIDDKIDLNLDKVGSATADGVDFDLILERTTGTDGGPVWLFSPETIAKIPAEAEHAVDDSIVENVAPQALKENLWAGIPVAHWLSMLLLIALGYALALGITRLIVFVIPFIWKKAKEGPYYGIIQSFVLPVRLYLMVIFFITGSKWLGISIIVRQRFSNLALLAFAFAFLLLLWQLMNNGSKYLEKRMERKGNFAAVSTILFLRRMIKMAFFFVALIVVLDTFGFSVTTWLAGLGIVGLALALGTQKTVENFVGSVTLIADQPVRVGDFCKAGDVSGTIERIGMRTTSIRTNERTIVSIPNGEFSSMKIENFAARDRFLFQSIITLSVQTDNEPVHQVLKGLRVMLSDHAKVTPDPARVRFIKILPEGFKIEIFCYVDTKDANEFLKVQEELYLSITEIVKTAGASFATPLQPILINP